MKIIKILIESFLPLALSTLITFAFYYFNLINKDEFLYIRIAFFIFSTIILMLLIKLKNVILSINRQNYKGFKKLYSNIKLTKRFFSYLKNPIYLSILVMLCNLFCLFIDIIYLKYAISFIFFTALFQTIRFLIIFNIVLKTK